MQGQPTILRLKTGEDIIASVFDLHDGKLMVSNPMVFEFISNPNSSKHILGMSFWLPVQVMELNEVVLWDDDVLAVIVPNTTFSDYYIKSIGKYTDNVNYKDNATSDVDINQEEYEVLEAIEELKETTNIH